MDEFHRAASGLIQICRDAVNDVVYGGEAPHDSNALSEHWPTREGAAFTGEYRGQKFMVVVLPQSQLPEAGSLGWPDYSVLDDASATPPRDARDKIRAKMEAGECIVPPRLGG